MFKNNAGFISPEFVIMVPLAATLDAIGIVLVIFALDDFLITDIIGWLTLGIWSHFRSMFKGNKSIEGSPTADKQELAQRIKQTQPDKTVKTAKAGKWARWIRFLEFVPYLGAVPFWTISTILILRED